MSSGSNGIILKDAREIEKLGDDRVAARDAIRNAYQLRFDAEALVLHLALDEESGGAHRSQRISNLMRKTRREEP